MASREEASRFHAISACASERPGATRRRRAFPLDLWQYLHAATFNIVDPDDSLADAVIDHHEVDPFIPCPNDATHELLRNTLIYNGTVVPAHGFLGERSREGKLPAFSYQGMRVAGQLTEREI